MTHLLEKVGKNYDDKVKEWRDCIIAELDASDAIVSCHEQHLYIEYITFITDNLSLCSKLTEPLGLLSRMMMFLHQTVTPPPATVTQILTCHGRVSLLAHLVTSALNHHQMNKRMCLTLIMKLPLKNAALIDNEMSPLVLKLTAVMNSKVQLSLKFTR